MDSNLEKDLEEDFWNIWDSPEDGLDEFKIEKVLQLNELYQKKIRLLIPIIDDFITKINADLCKPINFPKEHYIGFIWYPEDILGICDEIISKGSKLFDKFIATPFCFSPNEKNISHLEPCQRILYWMSFKSISFEDYGYTFPEIRETKWEKMLNNYFQEWTKEFRKNMDL